MVEGSYCVLAVEAMEHLLLDILFHKYHDRSFERVRVCFEFTIRACMMVYDRWVGGEQGHAHANMRMD